MAASQSTTSQAVIPTSTLLPAEWQEMEEYMGSGHSKSTDRSYLDAWNEFEAWAVAKGFTALPAQPAVVGKYLTYLADKCHNKTATIDIKKAGIAYKHREAGQADPTKAELVRRILSNIKRKHGTEPAKKAPLSLDDLQAMVGKLDAASLAGRRDRALILVGFAGAFRRSELVGLDVEDLRINGELKIKLRKSKTDQEGHGMTKVIPSMPGSGIDPITALLDWLDAAGIKSGPVFRQIDRWGHTRPDRLTPQSVALVIKAAALAAGLDPRQFAGHSLRSGFITTAYTAGASATDIAEVSGHKSLDVLRGYIQDAGHGGKRAILAAFKSEGNDYR